MTIEIIERLRVATGPDREIDAAITIAIGDGPGEGWELIRQNQPNVFNMDAGRWIKDGIIRTPKPYTASVDAALALANRLAPGRWNDILREAIKSLSVRFDWHTTPPQALQIALLPLEIIMATFLADCDPRLSPDGSHYIHKHYCLRAILLGLEREPAPK